MYHKLLRAFWFAGSVCSPMGVLALKSTLVFSVTLSLRISIVFRPRTTPGNPGVVAFHNRCHCVDDRCLCSLQSSYRVKNWDKTFWGGLQVRNRSVYVSFFLTSARRTPRGILTTSRHTECVVDKSAKSAGYLNYPGRLPSLLNRKFLTWARHSQNPTVCHSPQGRFSPEAEVLRLPQLSPTPCQLLTRRRLDRVKATHTLSSITADPLARSQLRRS